MGKYLIHAGDERPAFIEGQHLEKGQGQTLTAQGSKKIIYAVRAGDVGFPNMTEAWGVRLDKNGQVPELPLSVTDTLNYSGKVKWMDWGTQGGCAITARWLSGYNTLDLQYQKLVLKADDKLKDSFEESFILLKTGLNEFDEITDALKVEHLKIHNINRDSKSKNPEFVASMFFEKSEQAEIDKTSKVVDLKWDAISLVKTASKDNSLATLRNLKRAVEKLVAGHVEDAKLYTELMLVADAQPKEFIANVDEFKKFASNIFVDADAFKLLDLTKDGIIAAGKDKKEVIGSGVQGKGKNMIDWVIANCFAEKANDIIFSLKEITDKIKNQ